MKLCPNCQTEHDRNHRYCALCFAAYMRGWRITHPLSADQKAKDASRSYAGVYKRRGLLEQEDCRLCGSSSSEMHHPDYAKPLEVEWLCRPCHMDVHA